jgi:hypothetical protein
VHEKELEDIKKDFYEKIKDMPRIVKEDSI